MTVEPVEPVQYVLYPGFVRSRYDNQRHYISAAKLAELYGLPLSRCLIVIHDDWYSEASYRRYAKPTDVHLYPRYDGDYRLDRSVEES